MGDAAGISIREDRTCAALAVLFGFAFCWIWAGGALDPTNVAWLGRGDAAMHTLGWWFYRDAPWSWPPGASPNLGLEISNSVALADALPLFAIPFKLLDPVLPPQFQYWGLWFLLSFMLQGWFGYRLGRALDLSPPLALIAALFCIFSPPFLNRIAGHMALGGHWTILAALYLYVRPVPPPHWAWPLLLGVLAAIHGYLLAMCGGIWVAALVQRLWARAERPSALAGEVAAVLVAVFGILYLTGTFMVRGLTSAGYGVYPLQLLSPFDPNGWSRLLPDIPSINSEGFAFPGIGALIAILVMLPAALRSFRTLLAPRWLPLVVVMALLIVFAVTNVITVGPRVVARIPMPELFYSIAEIFRASGRMVWPLGYLSILVALVLAARRWPARATVIVALLLVLQVADTASQWSRFQDRATNHAEGWTTALASPLWDALATRYQRVRTIPVVEWNPNWLQLSYYARTHGMGTDAVYLGRIDRARLLAARDAAEQAVATGIYDPGAVYILNRGPALDAWGRRGPDDLLRELDGLFVFAPGGADLATSLGLAAQVQPHPAPAAPGPIAVNSNNKAAQSYLLDGWSSPEDWGAWTEQAVARLGFSAPGMAGGTLRLHARAFPPAEGQQQIEVRVNGSPVTTWVFPDRDFHDIELTLPDPLADDIVIDLAIASPTRPMDVGAGRDMRTLGLAVTEFELIPAAP